MGCNNHTKFEDILHHTLQKRINIKVLWPISYFGDYLPLNAKSTNKIITGKVRLVLVTYTPNVILVRFTVLEILKQPIWPIHCPCDLDKGQRSLKVVCTCSAHVNHTNPTIIQSLKTFCSIAFENESTFKFYDRFHISVIISPWMQNQRIKLLQVHYSHCHLTAY